MVLGRNVILILILGLGCATPKHAQDLPAASEVPDAGDEQGVVSDMPKQGDTELATSFDPEKEQPKEAPKPIAAEVKPAAGIEDEANARRTFDEQLAIARKAVASGKADEGRDAAKLAAESAEMLFPADAQKAAEVQFQIERAGTDIGAQWKTGLAWLLTCGPDRIDGCRAKVLASLSALAKRKEGAGLKDKLREVNDADTCVKKLEATRQAAVCETAHGVYHRQKDKLMTARLLLARALAVTGDPKKKDEAVALLGRAEAECTELRCVTIRRRALQERRRLALRDQDVAEAAKAALTEVKLASSLLPRAQRTYARTADVDRICTQLDAKEGPGTCRKLEKRINGEYSFRDFSAGKTLPGLGQDKVKEVNEHYACLLEECLSQQAERMRPPDMEEYEVRWMVLNDGRVGEVHLKRKTDEDSPLGQCLKEQFAVWRYPKYQGEFQHVEQRFTVSALKRR